MGGREPHVFPIRGNFEFELWAENFMNKKFQRLIFKKEMQ